MNNLHQITASVHMYADDSSDAFPPAVDSLPPDGFSSYTVLLRSYVGTAASQGRSKVFGCPADTFCYTNGGSAYVSHGLHSEARFYYSSYAFNGGNFLLGDPPAARWPGIAGKKLTSVGEPTKTVLVLEFPGLSPYSWHEPLGKAHVNNSKDVISFVDGHSSFTKIYWQSPTSFNHLEAWQYDPPANYDYRWSGD